MKKGDEIWTRHSDGSVARFQVTGTTTHGVAGVWLDGPLKGKEANVEKQTLSEMVANRRRPMEERLAELPEAPAEVREMLDVAIGVEPLPERAYEPQRRSSDEARATARERVRRWRAAKKGLKSTPSPAVEPGEGDSNG